jgi:proprotein convertase subtilisin/kexin type 5
MSSMSYNCSPICRSCHTGKASDCLECVENASFNTYGKCMCDPGWSGEDCSVSYILQCDSRCATCTGPTNYDCKLCTMHASKNMVGACVCDDFWHGDACTNYIPQTKICDPKCSGCTGPTATDCVSCVRNAYRNADGACQCKSEFVGDDCAERLSND